LYGLRLEQGAFILHGDRAYDAEYDWREEERRRPDTVAAIFWVFFFQIAAKHQHFRVFKLDVKRFLN
jgi:hypothetical protein